jgi:hypothetical protein
MRLLRYDWARAAHTDANAPDDLIEAVYKTLTGAGSFF